MPEPIDLKKVIRKNPAINEKQLQEVSTVLKLLKEHGVKGAEYNIIPPFSRQPAQASEKPEEDPRAIRLRT